MGTDPALVARVMRDVTELPPLHGGVLDRGHVYFDLPSRGEFDKLYGLLRAQGWKVVRQPNRVYDYRLAGWAWRCELVNENVGVYLRCWSREMGE